MGAVKNACHDEIEAKAFIAEEMPHAARLFEALANAIAPHLSTTARFEGEQWTISARVLHLIDADLDSRLSRVEAAVFPGEFNR